MPGKELWGCSHLYAFLHTCKWKRFMGCHVRLSARMFTSGNDLDLLVGHGDPKISFPNFRSITGFVAPVRKGSIPAFAIQFFLFTKLLFLGKNIVCSLGKKLCAVIKIGENSEGILCLKNVVVKTHETQQSLDARPQLLAIWNGAMDLVLLLLEVEDPHRPLSGMLPYLFLFILGSTIPIPIASPLSVMPPATHLWPMFFFSANFC